MSAPLELDLRAERCPLTFVRVRLLLESMAPQCRRHPFAGDR